MKVPSDVDHGYFSLLLMILVKRYRFIFQSKRQMHVNISKFVKLVEKQSGHTIKILRTNKGTKYITCDDFF